MGDSIFPNINWIGFSIAECKITVKTLLYCIQEEVHILL